MYHSISFAGDDKLRPGDDVTSSKNRTKNSFKNQKNSSQFGSPDRSLKSKKEKKETHRHPSKKSQKVNSGFPIIEKTKTPVCGILQNEMAQKIKKEDRIYLWIVPKILKTG